MPSKDELQPGEWTGTRCWPIQGRLESSVSSGDSEQHRKPERDTKRATSPVLAAEATTLPAQTREAAGSRYGVWWSCGQALLHQSHVTGMESGASALQPNPGMVLEGSQEIVQQRVSEFRCILECCRTPHTQRLHHNTSSPNVQHCWRSDCVKYGTHAVAF